MCKIKVDDVPFKNQVQYIQSIAFIKVKWEKTCHRGIHDTVLQISFTIAAFCSNSNKCMHNNDITGSEMIRDHIASTLTHCPFDKSITQDTNHATSYIFMVFTHTCTSCTNMISRNYRPDANMHTLKTRFFSCLFV